MNGYGEECFIDGRDLPEGSDRGINGFTFRVLEVKVNGDGETFVAFHADVSASEDVIDASEEDYPILDVLLTKQQFKSVLKAMHRFDEKISSNAAPQA